MIDTVRVNDRFYLGVAGIGFDADVSWDFSECKQRGFRSYVTLALKKLPCYKSQVYNLSIDGESFLRKAFLISFANSSQFGNGATIAPQAKINDGYLDVVIMRKVPFYALAHTIYRLFHKSLDHSHYVETIRAKKIDIEQENLKAQIDGEPILFPNGMHLEIVPSSLRILVPNQH